MMIPTVTQLRIGFVPEHFSTPLHFAAKYFSLRATLVPFPSGTGHMITALRSGEIDIGIGLTEGWVAGLGKGDFVGDGGYRIVGKYVETPLCWAISTGAKRHIKSIADFKNGKIGVSRIGSGSHVMGFVLADQQGWLQQSSSSAAAPFKVIPLQTFDQLRASVNDNTVDFFMWEHFTSKRYYDNGEIKRVGEIKTPWSSWMIVATSALVQDSIIDPRLEAFFDKLNKGIEYFGAHQEEAVEYISTELDYSAGDAREWLKTVEFSKNVNDIDLNVIVKTIDTLKKAGVIKNGDVEAESMIWRWSGAQGHSYA